MGDFNLDSPSMISIFEIVALLVFTITLFWGIIYLETLQIYFAVFMMLFAFAVMFAFDKIYFRIKKRKSFLWHKVRT